MSRQSSDMTLAGTEVTSSGRNAEAGWLKKIQGVMETSGRGRSRQRLALRDLRAAEGRALSMRWVGKEHKLGLEAEGPWEGL